VSGASPDPGSRDGASACRTRRDDRDRRVPVSRGDADMGCPRAGPERRVRGTVMALSVPVRARDAPWNDARGETDRRRSATRQDECCHRVDGSPAIARIRGLRPRVRLWRALHARTGSGGHGRADRPDRVAAAARFAPRRRVSGRPTEVAGADAQAG